MTAHSAATTASWIQIPPSTLAARPSSAEAIRIPDPEPIERAAWLDLAAAVPRRLRRALELDVSRRAGALVLCAPGAHHAHPGPADVPQRAFRSQLDALLLDGSRPTGPEVVASVGRSHARAFGRLAAASLLLPRPWDEALAELVGRPGWQVIGAFDGFRLVAAGALFVAGDEGLCLLDGAADETGSEAALAGVHRGRALAALTAGCRVLVERRPDLD